jgi:hypothetical protein
MNRVALGATVAPGQERTVTWTVTAPLTPGTYNFQWRMLQEFVAWFGATSPNIVVNVQAPAGNGAAFVSQSVPTTMTAGQLYQVSVRFRNAGGTTWGPNHKLGSQNPHDNFTWGINRVLQGGSVAPGQDALFTWIVRAPTTPGNYNFQWRMLQEGVEWFGPTSTNVVVSVQAPAIAEFNGAEFVSQGVPTVMQAGRMYDVVVRVRNSGTKTWTAGSYRLGSQNPHDNSNWGMNRVLLDADVAPGEQKDIAWRIAAPAVPGNYNFQWRMLQELIEWFGETSVNVTVSVQ